MRSLSSENVREYGPRVLKIAAGGLLTLLISAALITMRILLCDDTDIIWDHPSMFWDVVKMSYDESGRSTWGPLWDMIFAIVPMLIYGGAFVPRMWEGDADEYAPYRRTLWDELRERIPPEPPVLEWGYAEYEVIRHPEPVVRSRTPTLRGFPCVRLPAHAEAAPPEAVEPAKPDSRALTEFDEGWFLPDEP